MEYKESKELFGLFLIFFLLVGGIYALTEYRKQQLPENEKQFEELKKKLEDIVDKNYYLPVPGEKG